jgi:hypothetical protein
MARAIRLSVSIFNDAQRYAKVENRSVPKQIEHWSRIGKIAQDNPDLNYAFIKQILLSLEDVDGKDISKYDFD